MLRKLSGILIQIKPQTREKILELILNLVAGGYGLI
jgi:hypothetical protein